MQKVILDGLVDCLQVSCPLTLASYTKRAPRINAYGFNFKFTNQTQLGIKKVVYLTGLVYNLLVMFKNNPN